MCRSSGERGASVAKLRGTHGADFEGTAVVLRGGAPVGCSCIFGGGADKSQKFVLVKGPFCFVFKSAGSSAPLYAVNLVDMKTEQKGDVALLQTTLGDTDYEFKFSSLDEAKTFCKKVDEMAKSGQAEEIRKKLGHEHLLDRTKSIMFAENIATKKVDDQPSAPFSHDEIMANVPINAM